MSGPCAVDTDCIALNTNGFGQLEATPILSPDAGNAIECRPNGLYAQVAGAVRTTATTPASAAPFTITAVNPAQNVVQTGSFSVTNPSATRSARYLIIADLGSVDFFTVPPTNIPSSLVYTRTLPNAFVLQHRFTLSNQVAVSYRMEDAACPEFFSGTLAPLASVTVQVQRAVNYAVAGAGGAQGVVGRIIWHGLVFPA